MAITEADEEAVRRSYDNVVQRVEGLFAAQILCATFVGQADRTLGHPNPFRAPALRYAWEEGNSGRSAANLPDEAPSTVEAQLGDG